MASTAGTTKSATAAAQSKISADNISAAGTNPKFPSAARATIDSAAAHKPAAAVDVNTTR